MGSALIDVSTERESLNQMVLEPLAIARDLRIVNSDTHISAGELLRDIRGLRIKVSDSYDPIIKAAHAAHKQALEQKGKIEAPLIEAENIVKRAMCAYETEQERLRRQEELRLQAIARKAEEERLLREAEAAAAAGDQDAAMEILEEEIQPMAVIVPKSTPKTTGVSYRENWTFRIVNPALVPREYLSVDESKLRGLARAMKGAVKVPGVEFYAEKTAAVRY